MRHPATLGPEEAPAYLQGERDLLRISDLLTEAVVLLGKYDVPKSIAIRMVGDLYARDAQGNGLIFLYSHIQKHIDSTIEAGQSEDD